MIINLFHNLSFECVSKRHMIYSLLKTFITKRRDLDCATNCSFNFVINNATINMFRLFFLISFDLDFFFHKINI